MVEEQPERPEEGRRLSLHSTVGGARVQDTPHRWVAGCGALLEALSSPICSLQTSVDLVNIINHIYKIIVYIAGDQGTAGISWFLEINMVSGERAAGAERDLSREAVGRRMIWLVR